MKTNEITVKSLDEFQEQVDKKDFRISKIIVNSILTHLTSKKNNIHIITVNCTEDSTSYDLSLNRKHFAETLQENLKYFEEKEMYEECSKIVSAIEFLKEI